MNADHFSFSYYLEYALLFLDDNVDEECDKKKSDISRSTFMITDIKIFSIILSRHLNFGVLPV